MKKRKYRYQAKSKTNKQTNKHTHTHPTAHTRTYTHLHTHTQIYIYMHTPKQTYTHAHARTRTHTQYVPDRDRAASSMRSSRRPGVATTTYTHTQTHICSMCIVSFLCYSSVRDTLALLHVLSSSLLSSLICTPSAPYPLPTSPLILFSPSPLIPSPAPLPSYPLLISPLYSPPSLPNPLLSLLRKHTPLHTHTHIHSSYLCACPQICLLLWLGDPTIDTHALQPTYIKHHLMTLHCQLPAHQCAWHNCDNKR